MKSLEAIERAVEFIENRLTEALGVEAVAAAAGLSPAYCQRLFRATVGIPIGSYIRRRRLSRSVAELLETDRRILEIALEAGFDSQEAYTRAFKVCFGIPPGRFRERAQRMPADHFPAMTRTRIERRQADRIRPARFVDRPESSFVGVAGVFTSALSDQANDAEVVPQLWVEFLRRESEIDGRRSSAAYGLCWPEPADPMLRTDQLRYLAGAEVDPSAAPPARMLKIVAPPTRYAVFEHSGPVVEIADTILHALVEWLPESDFDYVTGFEIDVHPEHPEQGPTEYWLPVVEKGGR